MEAPWYAFGKVVNDNGRMGTPIVHGREGIVAFLACRVPNLKLESFTLHLQSLRQKGSYRVQMHDGLEAMAI